MSNIFRLGFSFKTWNTVNIARLWEQGGNTKELACVCKSSSTGREKKSTIFKSCIKKEWATWHLFESPGKEYDNFSNTHVKNKIFFHVFPAMSITKMEKRAGISKTMKLCFLRSKWNVHLLWMKNSALCNTICATREINTYVR